MDRRLQPSDQIQVLVNADRSVVRSKRRMSLAGPAQQSPNVTPFDTRYRRMSLASVASPISYVTPSNPRNRRMSSIVNTVSSDYGVVGKKAIDGRRRESESTSDPRTRKKSLAGSASPDLAVVAKKARDGRRRQSESSVVVPPSNPRNRRMSLVCSFSPFSAVPARVERDGRRRQSESVGATDPTVLDNELSRTRRLSSLTQSPTVKVAEMVRKKSTVFLPTPSLQREPLGEVSNSLPLAEVTMMGNSSEGERLVLEELDNVQTDQIISPFLD